jgi:phosphoserine phosphatase
MTRIILVRHGHVDWLAPERFRGRAELPLSDLGHRQAQAAAGYIAATWKPDAVYTSPLGRCRETGAVIAAPFHLEPQPVDGLADIDYGEWQGLTRDQAKQRWPDETELWFRSPHLALIPGGETLAAVLSRATAALRDIMRDHRDGTVAMVGHDSINRVLLLFALELPLSRYWRLRQDPCGVNELFFDGGHS